MAHLQHLATRVFNTPLILHPHKTEVVLAALAERMGIVSLDGFAPRPVQNAMRLMEDEDDWAVRPAKRKERVAGYDIIEGIAVIPVEGTLVNKLGTLRPYSGMTGYDGIRQNVLAADRDSDVRAKMLLIHSPGGEVHGCFDLVDTIYNMRGRKPTWAVLDENAFSGGYAIASAADRIIVPRTGGVGSIGVIWLHCDYSQAIENAGLKVTIVKYGDKKGAGFPHIPLSKEAHEQAQEQINATGELFVSTVARNLDIPKERVINTQAGTFMGAEGVKAGLAHAVASPDEALRSFIKYLDGK